MVGVALLTSSSASLPPPLFGSAEEGAILYNRMGEKGATHPSAVPPVKALALAAKRPPKGQRPPALASPFGESGRGALRAPSPSGDRGGGMHHRRSR